MKIKQLFNIHEGKRCFILANGPSINQLNLSLLKNEISIGINASTLLEEKFDFIQTYYTVSDLRFFDIDYKRELATQKLNQNTICVFRKEIKDIPNLENRNQTFFIPALERDGFSFNLCYGYYYGGTTVMLALQLAYYLGCKEIYLLGLDLNYSSNSPRFYQENTMQIDDAKSSIQIFNISKAAVILKEKGVDVFNCNPASLARNYLPFMDFNNLF